MNGYNTPDELRKIPAEANRISIEFLRSTPKTCRNICKKECADFMEISYDHSVIFLQYLSNNCMELSRNFEEELEEIVNILDREFSLRATCMHLIFRNRY